MELTEQHSYALLDIAAGKLKRSKATRLRVAVLVEIGLVNPRTLSLTDAGKRKAAEYN